MQPAYVFGRRWDILAWNTAAVALFGDYARLEGEERNILSLLFLNQDHRHLLLDWDDIAMSTLAMFRADTAVTRANLTLTPRGASDGPEPRVSGLVASARGSYRPGAQTNSTPPAKSHGV